jgi:hypothetical protein
MSKRGRYFSALWLLLILFPVVQSSFAQASGGAEVKVRLLETLDSSQTKPGQEFSATVAEPVVAGKRVILAKGTAIRGRVTEVIRPGHMKTPASIGLVLTNVVGTRGANALQSELLVVDGQSHALRNTALIGGGAGAGAVVGGIADGGKGALIGAGVGAAAGGATAYLTGKKELVLPVETELTFLVDPRTLGIAPEPKATILETSMRRGSGVAGSRDSDQDAYDALIFSERDQAVIRSYYRPHGEAGLPPGLAKKNGNLPPGLQRKLQANEVLPPGLEKQVEPLPVDLEGRLPRLPRGYSRVMMNGRAMTIDTKSRIIDVFVVF